MGGAVSLRLMGKASCGWRCVIRIVRQGVEWVALCRSGGTSSSGASTGSSGPSTGRSGASTSGSSSQGSTGSSGASAGGGGGMGPGSGTPKRLIFKGRAAGLIQNRHFGLWYGSGR